MRTPVDLALLLEARGGSRRRRRGWRRGGRRAARWRSPRRTRGTGLIPMVSGLSMTAMATSVLRVHDLACVVHLHSTYSDGTGTVPQIARAAKHAGVDVVLLTDHDTLAAKERGEEGWHGEVLAAGRRGDLAARRQPLPRVRPRRARAPARAGNRPRSARPCAKRGRFRLRRAPVVEGLGALQEPRPGHALPRPRLPGPARRRAVELRHRHRREPAQHPRDHPLPRPPRPRPEGPACAQPRRAGTSSAASARPSRSAASTRTSSASASARSSRSG